MRPLLGKSYPLPSRGGGVLTKVEGRRADIRRLKPGLTDHWQPVYGSWLNPDSKPTTASSQFSSGRVSGRDQLRIQRSRRRFYSTALRITFLLPCSLHLVVRRLEVHPRTKCRVVLGTPLVLHSQETS